MKLLLLENREQISYGNGMTVLKMRKRTRFIRDGTGRYKLKVSLPGGRYQLSLDSGAIIALQDGLGLAERDKVPEPFVRIFVAAGDAWFPNERDIDGVIEDLPADGKLSKNEREELIRYVEDKRVPPRNRTRFRRAVEESPIADDVDLDYESKQDQSQIVEDNDDEPLPEFDDLMK
ncbi:MAG: hypothetical protein ABEJ76_08930 [Halanaeroarchaeum sp.]